MIDDARFRTRCLFMAAAVNGILGNPRAGATRIVKVGETQHLQTHPDVLAKAATAIADVLIRQLEEEFAAEEHG